ncbi:hypothetical protein AB0K51_12760 [Kitasatospora sp. NPDC049285]|uniref:diacylglycerol/lipid kinase family protein n=1 Tax=Kitasatospora sp. NPDC049285 TaxID=3157096 RepID=UPI00341B8983
MGLYDRRIAITDLGLHTVRDTADAVRNGHSGSVDLGRITPKGAGGEDAGDAGRAYFLNTFSIGVYPELVRARESLERCLGKWPALAVGLVRVLAQGEPTRAVVIGRERSLWLLFAGNGRYDPPGFAPSFRRDLTDGALDVRIVDGSHPFARTRLVAAFLTGTLARSRVYRSATLSRLRVDGIHDTEHYARDGEVVHAADTLLLDKAPRSLTVYLPATDRPRPERDGRPRRRRRRPDAGDAPHGRPGLGPCRFPNPGQQRTDTTTELG